MSHRAPFRGAVKARAFLHPHRITRRLTLGLPLLLAQRSALPNAEVGGSSPPRPTTVMFHTLAQPPMSTRLRRLGALATLTVLVVIGSVGSLDRPPKRARIASRLRHQPELTYQARSSRAT